MEREDAWVALGQAWLRKARASTDQGLYVNADGCASVVLARAPNHAAASRLRVTVLTQRREWAEARSLAERTTAQHPDDAAAWGQLTDVLVELGRYEEAIVAVKKMLALGASPAAWRRTAHLQWLRGDVAHAKESLDAAIEASGGDDGEHAATSSDRGMIAWHEGDYGGAEASFDDALKRVPEHAPALAGKGRVAMARGDHAHAADLFARSYARAPLLETQWLLGDARSAAGDAKGAEECHAVMAQERARDPRTYSLFLSTKTDATEAERREALDLASQEHVKRVDVYTEDALAWALYRRGMVQPAKTSMARARRLRTPDARIVFHEGAIRIAGGDAAKGRELVAQALARNPAFDWRGAREARALLR